MVLGLLEPVEQILTGAVFEDEEEPGIGLESL